MSLVWTKAPFLFRNELVPVDSLATERSAAPTELKRLGDDPLVVELTTGATTLEVAARDADRDLLRGPYEIEERNHATDGSRPNLETSLG
jgi:hypothetical protein